MTTARRDIVVAITGASGAVYARRLLQCLASGEGNVHTHVIVSPHGRQLLADELGIRRVTADSLVGGAAARLTLYAHNDVGCALASGSFLTEGMIVCPCSGNTLGAIAAGLGDNLVNRAAQVTLKEGRRLVLVHREMPLSVIDLENMLRISRAGGIMCPAAPGFYMRPETIDDLVDFVVGKLLDLFHVPHTLNTRWAEPQLKVSLPRRRTAEP